MRIPATSGGVIAFPIRAHECVMPCANPHFSAGVQVDIARVAVGKAGPSPKPKAIRAAISDMKPPVSPVSTVEIAAITQQVASTKRAPKRSASHPPKS